MLSSVRKSREIVARRVITRQLIEPRLSNLPEVTPFASQIDPRYPVYGTPTTQSVRDNFQFAHDEIESLQLVKLDDVPATPPGATWERQLGVWVEAIDSGIADVPTTPAGAVWERSSGAWVQAVDTVGITDVPTTPSGAVWERSSGAWIVASAPGITDVPTTPAGAKWERTLGAWTQAIDVTGIPEAPVDGVSYARMNATWSGVLPLTGGSLNGNLTLTAGDITLFQPPLLSMHAVNKQYVDDITTALSGVLVLAGTYDVTNDLVAAGGSLGGIADGPLPPPGAAIANRYLILTDAGTGTGNAPPIAMSAGSWLVCDGTVWIYIDVAQATSDASSITVNPPILGATNVNDALTALSVQPILTDTSLTGNGQTATPLKLARVDGDLVSVTLNQNIGKPATLINGEPLIDGTVGAPKLWGGIAGVVTLLSDPALVTNLEQRVVTLETAVPPTGIGEAPIDGQSYLRNGLSASWVAYVTPPAGGINEAPIDGATYGRVGATATWVSLKQMEDRIVALETWKATVDTKLALLESFNWGIA